MTLKSYSSQTRALKHVEYLARTRGVWPAVVSHPDGTFTLSFEPDAYLDDNDET